MSRVQIERIRINGLKARNLTIRLAPVSVLVGENGRSKSAIIDAIYLLALGFAPGHDRTPDGVMSLAKERHIEIDADIVIDGESHVITREWKRDRGGRVAETIKGTVRELGEKSVAQKRAYLAGLLGSYVEAWAPGEILDLSPAKLRARLLSRIPQQDLSVGAIVPADCPSWALPSETTVTAFEWAAHAIKKGRTEVERMQASTRETERKLEEDLGDAWDEQEPLEPIHQDLAAYRSELLDLRAREMSQARIERLHGEVARLRAGTANDLAPIEVVRLVAAILECAAAESRYVLAEHRKIVEAAGSQWQAATTALRPFADAPLASIEDLTRIEEDFDSAEDEVSRAKKQLAELRGAHAVLDRPHLTKCPDCGADLLAHAETLKKRLEGEIADAVSEVEMFVAVAAGLREARVQVRRGVERADLEAMVKERERRLREVVAASDAVLAGRLVPDRTGDMTAYLSIEQANRADEVAMRSISAATERARAARDLISAEERLAAALLEIDAFAKSTRTPDQVEALIRAAEVELGRRSTANARRAEYRSEKEALANFERLEEERKVWVDKFKNIQTDLVHNAKGWLEERLTKGLGGNLVTIELLDARGNDDCRIAVNGVDATTLSDGERATFLAALVITLAEVSEAPWKPLIVDRFEHVSRKFRAPFLTAVASAVQEGRISCAILAGCPDAMPEVDGVEVIDMDALDNGTNRKLAVAGGSAVAR